MDISLKYTFEQFGTTCDTFGNMNWVTCVEFAIGNMNWVPCVAFGNMNRVTCVELPVLHLKI